MKALGSSCKYSRTLIIRIDWDGEPSGYAGNPDNGILLFENRLQWQLEMETNFCKRLF